MRLLGRALLLIAALVAAWWLTPTTLLSELRTLFGQERDAWKLELLPQAGISPIYIAERSRWLNFPVPGDANRVRLVSNANLYDLAKAAARRSADPRTRWRYALEIEVLDAGGQVLLRRVHHHRTDIAELRLGDGRIVTPAFYLNAAFTPMEGVVVTLNLAGLPQAARLRVRAAEQDADIADIAVRTYFPEPASDRDAEHQWQRLSERQKTAFAKGSVYAHELLTEAERRNLLLNQWQPAGPQGAQGNDFAARDLYVLRDVEAEPVDDPVPPAGLIAGPGRPAVFFVPEAGAGLRFEAVPLGVPATLPPPGAVDAGIAPPTPTALTVRWFGSGPRERAALTLPLAERAGVMQAEHRFAGGQIEIEAATPVALRAYMTVAERDTEVTPERLFHRFYLAGDEAGVDYRIAHEGAQATPIRLTARHLIGSPQAMPHLHYAFLDAEGKTVAEGRLALPAEASSYDEPLNTTPGARVSDPLEQYFSVPPGVERLRLRAEPAVTGNAPAPVLVALASRPARLPREIRAPEDRFAFTLPGAPDARIPAWFALRPEAYATLIGNNRSQLVAVQARPPVERPELITGRYQWEDLRPGGRWLARPLLAPRDPAFPLRDEALVATYRPLPAGRELHAEFPAWMGLRQLTPNLLWVAPDDTPFSATLYVDGRPVHRFGGHGRHGETRLPPLAAGSHTLRLALEGATQARFFVNLARPGTDSYILRLATRLGTGVSFDIERRSRGEETITARLFQPAAWQGRTHLIARLEGPAPAPLTPLPGWRFDERHIDVRPDPSWAAPIFDTRGERSDAGQPVFIQIPEGAPPGRYRLHVRLESGPAGYLSVSRIVPGLAERRRIFEETEVRSVSEE